MSVVYAEKVEIDRWPGAKLPHAVKDTHNLVANEITSESLLQLANREIGAIHIKGFYSPEIGEAVAKKVANHPELGHYHKKYTNSVARTYMAHVDTKWDPLETKNYHDSAINAIADIRSMFYPYLSPIDHVRLLLQEHWPAGAVLQRLRGRACFVGACRLMQPDTSFFYAHNDYIYQETDAPEVEGIGEQFVANAYIQAPPEGGVLELWLRDPTPEERERILEVEGLEPHTIEPPRLTIRPESGDLILCSSRMLHSVTRARGGQRVCMATFIGVKSPEEPLVCWS